MIQESAEAWISFPGGGGTVLGQMGLAPFREDRHSVRESLHRQRPRGRRESGLSGLAEAESGYWGAVDVAQVS